MLTADRGQDTGNGAEQYGSHTPASVPIERVNCIIKGHPCGQLLAAEFTRTGTYSSSGNNCHLSTSVFKVFKGEFMLCMKRRERGDCSNNVIYSKILKLLRRRAIMKPLL